MLSDGEYYANKLRKYKKRTNFWPFVIAKYTSVPIVIRGV